MVILEPPYDQLADSAPTSCHAAKFSQHGTLDAGPDQQTDQDDDDGDREQQRFHSRLKRHYNPNVTVCPKSDDDATAPCIFATAPKPHAADVLSRAPDWPISGPKVRIARTRRSEKRGRSCA